MARVNSATHSGHSEISLSGVPFRVNSFINELSAGWPQLPELARILVRLTAAAVLGAVIGLQRESMGKPAGLRTHMLVATGAALFVASSFESGMSLSDISRIIQGLATGIGFIGAGAILKMTEQHEITGLTTAASVWMTGAVGVAVGLGRWGAAAISVILSWMILALLGRLEFWAKTKRHDESSPD